jgi:hypothetical protein
LRRVGRFILAAAPAMHPQRASNEEAAMSHHEPHQHQQGAEHHGISPIAVQKALKGANYPASKQDLVHLAQQNHAPTDVIQKIQALPGDHYDKVTDVTRALGQTE